MRLSRAAKEIVEKRKGGIKSYKKKKQLRRGKNEREKQFATHPYIKEKSTPLILSFRDVPRPNKK